MPRCSGYACYVHNRQNSGDSVDFLLWRNGNSRVMTSFRISTTFKNTGTCLCKNIPLNSNSAQHKVLYQGTGGFLSMDKCLGCQNREFTTSLGNVVILFFFVKNVSCKQDRI